MNRVLMIALFIAVASGVAERGVEANSKPVRILKPEGFDLSRNPELAFSATGELYVACRDRETRDASSFLSVVALDVTTGRELRRSRLGVPRISLAGHFPWPLAKFMLSPDGSLLLYSEHEDGHFMATIDARTLQLVSMRELLPLDKPDRYPSPQGFGADGGSVLAFTGWSDGAEVTAFDARDLNKVLKKTVVPRPPGEKTAAWLDDTGAVWFADGGFSFSAFTRYDSYGRAGRSISTGRRPVMGYVLFLRGGIVLAFMFELDSHEIPFGMVTRYDESSERPTAVMGVDGCEVHNAYSLTSDQRFVVQLCKRIRQTDPGFGQVLKSNLVVLDTQNLRAVAEIATPRRWTAFSAWHGSNHTLVAIATPKDGIEIYSLPDSSSEAGNAR